MSTTAEKETIKLVLADGYQIFRDGFRSMLNKEKHQTLKLVAEAGNGAELIASMEKFKPDIVITNRSLGDIDGLEASRFIHQYYPDTGIIMVSSSIEESVLINMFSLGIKGYLVKESHHNELFEAIQVVYNGGRYFCTATSKKFNAALLSLRNKQAKSLKNQKFSNKENEIMKLICKQFTTKEIAQELNLKSRTVEDYRKKIQEKIGARNMAGIVVYAIKNNIVRLSEIGSYIGVLVCSIFFDGLTF